MATQKKLLKLQQVIRYHQNELEALKTESFRQSQQVKQLQNKAAEISQQISNTQAMTEHGMASVTSRQITSLTLSQLEDERKKNQTEIAEAKGKLEKIRVSVVEKISKVESLEKATEKLSTRLEYERNRKAQVAADDRYLGTQFNGISK